MRSGLISIPAKALSARPSTCAISWRHRSDAGSVGEAGVTKVDGRQIEFAVRATEGAKEIGVGSAF
jgi:hypothetical protein